MLVDDLEVLPYRHERVWLSASRTPLGSLRSLAGTWPRTARDAQRYDLLHVVGDAAACIVLPLLRGRPSVVNTQGLHLLRRTRGKPVGRLVQGSFGLVLRTATRTACSSPSEQRELESLVDGEAAARIVLVRNGVDVPRLPGQEERAAMRAELGLREHDIVGLFAGQLEPRKDPLTVIRAAAAVREQGFPFVLLVAGEGPLAQEVAALAGTGLRALGFRADMGRLLAATDVFTMPSEREGLSLAVLEAMAHGLPVVASDVPGNVDALADAGLVVRFGDVAAFTQAFARLAADPTERARLGLRARQRVEQEFTKDRMLRELHAVFDAALREAKA